MGSPLLFARCEPREGHTLDTFQPRAIPINQNWPKSGPQLNINYVGWIWPRLWPDLAYCSYLLLACGHVMASLWPRFGKQELTSQMTSFHTVHEPDEHVWCFLLSRCHILSKPPQENMLQSSENSYET